MFSCFTLLIFVSSVHVIISIISILYYVYLLRQTQISFNETFSKGGCNHVFNPYHWLYHLQISDLKNKMESSELSSSESLEKLRQELENEKKRLEDEVKKVERESSVKVDNLEREHREQMEALQKQKADELAVSTCTS